MRHAECSAPGMVRLALVVMVMSGCDAALLSSGTGWHAEPSSFEYSSGIDTISYATPSAGGWRIYALEFDGAVRCSEAPDLFPIELMWISERAFTEPASIAFGDVEDPSVPSATLTLRGRRALGGTLMLSAVDDRIAGSFFGAMIDEFEIIGTLNVVPCD